MTPTVPRTLVPHAPEDISSEFLSEVLKLSYDLDELHVVDFIVVDAEMGALSHVVYISAEYTEGSYTEASQKLPKQFVAKFSLPGLPQPAMFEVESNFYRGTWTTKQKETFFKLPYIVFTSSHLIITERVVDVQTHKCLDGCPPQYILPTVVQLAKFHARHWGEECVGLSAVAGVGAFVDGRTKQAAFPKAWSEFVATLDTPDIKAQAVQMCEDMCTRRLHEIHDEISQGPATVIHGDFHTENLLFAMTSVTTGNKAICEAVILLSEGSESISTDGINEGTSLNQSSVADSLAQLPYEQQDIWLVDWATSGRGCPLRDLAFFMMVGITSTDRKLFEKVALRVYHGTLLQEGVKEFSWEQCTTLYSKCVINQFVILVALHRLTNNVAQSARTDAMGEHLRAHFKEVYQRCTVAAFEHYQGQIVPSVKPEEETLRDQEYLSRFIPWLSTNS